MKNFQDIIFIWIRTYRATFNSALVYLYLDNYFRKKLMSQMFDRVLNTPLFYKVMIMPRIFQHQKVKPVKLFLTQLIPFLFPMETAETFELIDTIFWLTWKKRSEVLYSCVLLFYSFIRWDWVLLKSDQFLNFQVYPMTKAAIYKYNI